MDSKKTPSISKEEQLARAFTRDLMRNVPHGDARQKVEAKLRQLPPVLLAALRRSGTVVMLAESERGIVHG